MINAEMIEKVALQLESVANRIISVASILEDEIDTAFVEDYEQMVMDEVTHVQILALQLTKIVTENEQTEEGNADDSVFGPGELTSVLGEKEVEYPEPEEEDEDK